jgi:hypothetical protein
MFGKNMRPNYRWVQKPPQMSKAKLIILLAIAPFLAWYSNQSTNNPWKMRSSYYIDSNSVVFFQENNRKKSDEFRIFVPLDSAGKNISNTHIYGWEIANRNWGILAKSGDTSIVFSFGDSLNFESSQILCDVLVSSGDSAKIVEERLFFRPKMTVWFAEKSEKPIASNVYIPKEKDKFRLVKSREKLEILRVK